jgi:hypothetical protein
MISETVPAGQAASSGLRPIRPRHETAGLGCAGSEGNGPFAGSLGANGDGEASLVSG